MTCKTILRIATLLLLNKGLQAQQWTHMFQTTENPGTSVVSGMQGAGGDGGSSASFVGNFNHSVSLTTGYQANRSFLFSEGGEDGFIVVTGKFNNTNEFPWYAQIGGKGDAYPRALHTDYQDRTIVVGTFSGEAHFIDTLGHDTTLISRGASDMFIARYGYKGALIWVRQACGTGVTEALNVTVTQPDYILVSGRFSSQARFNKDTITSNGGTDIFLARYDMTGGLVWVKAVGGTGDDVSNTILSPDAYSGLFYICGSYQTSVLFGTSSLTSKGASDMFIAKYNINGHCLWAKSDGGPGDDATRAMGGDDQGLILGGYFSDSAAFGTYHPQNKGLRDAFLASYDTSGHCTGVKTIGSRGNDEIAGVGYDPSLTSGPFGIGYFNDTVQFNNGQAVSNGMADVFLCDFGSTGLDLLYTHGGKYDDKPTCGNFDGSYFGGGGYYNKQIANATFPPTQPYTTTGTQGCIYYGSAVPVGNYDYTLLTSMNMARNKTLISSGTFFGVSQQDTVTLLSKNYQTMYLTCQDTLGKVIWAKSVFVQPYDTGYVYTNPSGVPYCISMASATDSLGNTYVSGTCRGKLKFGTIQHVCHDDNAFLIKYDNQGNAVWLKTATATPPTNGNYGPNTFNARKMLISTGGKIWIAGDIENSFTGDFSFSIPPFSGYSISVAFLMAFSPGGTSLYSSTVISPGAPALSSDIGTDNAGNIYWLGTYQSSTTDTTSKPNHHLPLNPQYYSGTFLIKTNSQSYFEYFAGRLFKSNTDGTLPQSWMGVEKSGGIFVSSRSQGNVIIGPDTVNIPYISYTLGAFISRFDSAGNIIWAKPIRLDSSASINFAIPPFDLKIALDPSGDPLLYGNHDGSLSFQGNPIHGSRSHSCHLIRLSKNGVMQWDTTTGSCLAVVNSLIGNPSLIKAIFLNDKQIYLGGNFGGPKSVFGGDTLVSYCSSMEGGPTFNFGLGTPTQSFITGYRSNLVCPNASFVSSPTSVCNSGAVSFNNTSTGLNNYSWLLNKTLFSNSVNASTSFSSIGNYTISLAAIENSCVDTATSIIHVIHQIPTASFTNTLSAFVVQCTNNSSNATQYRWSFGDGSTSTALNPYHTYTSTGTYSLCLTALNACGKDSVCDTVVIQVAGIQNIGLLDFKVSPNPSHGAFTISGLQEEVILEIFDLQGKLIVRKSLEKSTYVTIDLSYLDQGCYFMKLSGKKGAAGYKKLLIQ
jgi:PKD repeat protein